MRRDEHARKPPERVPLGQRFGVGDIERRADAPRPHVPHERVGVHERSAPDVDDQRAVGKGGELGVSDDVPRRISAGKGQHDDLRRRQQFRQLVDAVHADAVLVARPRRHRNEVHLEGRQPCGDRLADAAVAEQQHPPVREALGVARMPHPRAGVDGERVEVPLRGEGQPHRELGGGGLVHSRGVGEDDPGRELLRGALVADGLALHESGRHPRQQRQPVAAGHVGRYDQVDAVARGCGIHRPYDHLDAVRERLEVAGELGAGDGDDEAHDLDATRPCDGRAQYPRPRRCA